MATKRNTADIDTIVMHCTATKEGKDFTAKDVDAWHRQRGFDGIGYHILVRLDGTYERGRADNEVGAHCPQEGMNRRAIAICYVGGLDANGNPKDTRTAAQVRTMITLIRTYKARYPRIKAVVGHRDVKGVNKACPCFNARAEYAQLIK